MASTAAVDIPCSDVAAEVDHFVTLGWRVVDVFPADDPRLVTLDGHGVRLLVRRGEGTAPRLMVGSGFDTSTPSPSGVRIDPSGEVRPTAVLESSLSITTGSEPWHVGRAGMHYRDLVPDRQGGAVIASHIRIPIGGPVPDYPHFHEVVFQLIFCQKGWVRLAYESQGEPFVLHAGECVIQPPTIRHRVLESSDDLHVVELGFPAEHLTIADHEFDFRSCPVDPAREWDGQRFVRYTNDHKTWAVTAPGVEESDTGIADATRSRADVRELKMEPEGTHTFGVTPDRTFLMVFVLSGEVVADLDDEWHLLGEESAIVVPVGKAATFRAQTAAKLLVAMIDTTL
ncbi:MAG: hypothetical protein RLZ86_898 [Actinomycetota bacterium]